MAKVTIICELGTNWDPLCARASIAEMAAIAKDMGADFVKLQDWNPISEMNRSDKWKARCAPWTLTAELIRRCKDSADQLGVGLFCSVFTKAAVRRAAYGTASQPMVKIASSEASNIPLLRTVHTWYAPAMNVCSDRSGAPVLVSLGEIQPPQWERRLTTILSTLGACNVTLMHCIATYPAPVYQLYLAEIQGLLAYGLPVGWSSHVSAENAARCAAQAVRHGATVIEAHLRVRGITPENAPDNGAWSLYPDEFRELVKAVREAEEDRG